MRWTPFPPAFFLSIALSAPFVALSQGPPETPIRIVNETFFGREIGDPYRWLENVKEPEVLKWLSEQNAYTRSVIDRLPEREMILARIRQLDQAAPPPLASFARDARGNYYFYRTEPDGISKAYVRDRVTGKERLLIDPAEFSIPGGSSPKVSGLSPSPDGRYIAFLVRGTGRTRAFLVQTADRKVAGAPVDNVLGFTGLDWDPDSKSIYLVKMPPLRPDMKPSDALLGAASYRHIVGTDPASDQLLVSQGENRGLVLKETSWPFVFPTPNGKYLAVWIEDGARAEHELYVAPRDAVLKGLAGWKKIAGFENGATGIVFRGSDAFITAAASTDLTSRIIRVRIDKETLATGTHVVLPESVTALVDVQAASDALYVAAREGSAGSLFRVSDNGQPQRIALPVDGSIGAVSVIPEHPGGLFRIGGWAGSTGIFRVDSRGRWEQTRLEPASAAENLRLQVKALKVPSHDGTSVPLTLVYRQGVLQTGANPAYLIGYGSYGGALDPKFDNVYVPWFEAGGILAFAHVRGGGEFGKAWHLAGSKDKKPNTWLDFIACAEYLVREKYASPETLAGGGVSAGGILIGRAITERPALFRAALIGVGTTDMLRAEYQMNGPANIAEFGTTKDRTGFEQLYKMSAYHHVVQGVRYPAVLLSTGMKDTNVDVWQPAKMTARLQAVAVEGRPVLLRVDPEGGHDTYGSTRRQIQELRADQLAFLMWQLGVGRPPAR